MTESSLRDLAGEACTKCVHGRYHEETLADRWDGVLHCTGCGMKVARYAPPAPKFLVYADGSCKANGAKAGGRGGWGAVICDATGLKQQELSGGQAGTTNNQMELLAVIKALQHLPPASQVQVWTDSQYVVKGMTEWLAGWKRRHWMKPDGSPVLNRELWQQLEAATAGHRVSWHWVRGHNGHPGNERADALAQAAADRLAR